MSVEPPKSYPWYHLWWFIVLSTRCTSLYCMNVGAMDTFLYHPGRYSRHRNNSVLSSWLTWCKSIIRKNRLWQEMASVTVFFPDPNWGLPHLHCCGVAVLSVLHSEALVWDLHQPCLPQLIFNCMKGNLIIFNVAITTSLYSSFLEFLWPNWEAIKKTWENCWFWRKLILNREMGYAPWCPEMGFLYCH